MNRLTQIFLFSAILIFSRGILTGCGQLGAPGGMWNAGDPSHSTGTTQEEDHDLGNTDNTSPPPSDPNATSTGGGGGGTGGSGVTGITGLPGTVPPPPPSPISNPGAGADPAGTSPTSKFKPGLGPFAGIPPVQSTSEGQVQKAPPIWVTVIPQNGSDDVICWEKYEEIFTGPTTPRLHVSYKQNLTDTQWYRDTSADPAKEFTNICGIKLVGCHTFVNDQQVYNRLVRITASYQEKSGGQTQRYSSEEAIVECPEGYFKTFYPLHLHLKPLVLNKIIRSDVLDHLTQPPDPPEIDPRILQAIPSVRP